MAIRWQPGSIRGALALFVVALALPLVALIAYNLVESSRREIADAEATVRRVAENGADLAARFVEDTRLAVEPVSRRPLVRAMDPARCDPGLKDLLELYPRAGNFLVVNREGRIICGAIPPPRDRVVRIADEALLRQMLATKRFALSRPIVGRVNQRWSVAAVQPVTGDDGEVVGFVSMAIDLLNWRPLPAEASLPAGAVASLVTAGGIVIARSADAGAWVGRDASGGEVMRRVLELKEGTLRGRGVAGVDRIWAFRPVPGTDWTALSGIPTELVFAPMRARALRSALLLAVALGAALGLALLAARGVTRPVDESEARFRALWEASADAILILDEASVIRYANPAVLQLFGYRPEELVGQNLALLQPEAQAAAHREGFARYLRSGERGVDWRCMPARARRRDGGEFPVEISFSELRLGGRRYFAGFLSDVSDRMRAEKRLEMTQRLFAALSEVNETIVRVRERDELFHELCRIAVERLDFLLASVALVDAARQAVVPHIYAGPASGVLRDYRFPLDPAQPLASTVTSTAVRTRRAAVANDVEADPTKAAARLIRERTGAKSTAAFPLFQGGEVIGAFTVHAAARDFFDAPVVELLTRMAGDISFALDKLDEHDKLAELTRELEERVQRRTAELQAANEELEAFSYSVSHDLRAPVRHVDGFAQLLEKELKAPGAKAAHYLATIGAAARRMGALIDDLLQLSRTGRQVLGRRRVDTGALVRGLIHEAAPELARRKVEWEVGELPAVMADPALLRIVLQNLLSNAMKYSRPRPAARIAVSARAAGDGVTVEISVRDNGVGFDPRFKDKLFGVFQRLHREEEFEGTGIGLATARRIVHRHGQRIWGEGMPGEGATFSFTMALAREEGADEDGTHIAG